MTRAHVVGVAMTAFGNLAPADTLALQSRAASAALADAGLARADVDGLLVGYSAADPHLMPATRFAEHFGLRPTYAHGVQVGGATGLAMVALARHLIAAGAARTVMIVAGENRRSGLTSASALKVLAEVGDPVHEVPHGGSVPAYYGLLASRYLHAHGLGERDLAELSVLMRRHAGMTEGAHFTAPISVDDVMASRPVALPLKLLDCCPVSDGAAAVIVSAEDPRGDRLAIAGTAQAHTHQHISRAPDDVAGGAAVGARLSSAAALDQAGRSAGDVGRIAIYDSFTVTLAMLIEACGFAADGASAAAARDGRFDADGPLPLNTHGGLLSYGHSGVAGGLAHLVDLVRRMRGDAASGSPRRPVGFVHADGGVLSSHVSVVVEAGG